VGKDPRDSGLQLIKNFVGGVHAGRCATPFGRWQSCQQRST
jgi:hypothetical protein